VDQLVDSSGPVPPRLGKYDVIARLGKGGMAQIHLGLARGMGGFHKLVVLKRLESSDESFRHMFLDEARLAALLHHPNVVDTYEVSEAAGSYFIAMEYLEGQSLDKIIREMRKRGRQLEPPFCARLVADALSGLHYMHELRDYAGTPLEVVHRDVSPHNLFLTYAGHVKVLDFGVAQSTAQVAETEVGVLKGKLAYMAPEQAAAEPIDRRADVYSAGAVLWELLTLERLRTRESASSVLDEAIAGSVPDLASVRPGLDRRFDNVLWRALAKSPRRRYQTAQEMRDALLEYLVAHPCSQEDLAEFMQTRFAELRSRTQRQINACLLRAEAQDPVISVTDEEDSSLPQVSGVPRGLPILDSSSLPMLASDSPPARDDVATRPLAPAAMLPSNSPPPLRQSSSAARSRSPVFAEEPEAASDKSGLVVAGALLALVALLVLWLQRPSPNSRTPNDKAYGDPATTRTVETLLRLHGSNTIGQELAPRLVEAFLKKRGYANVELTGTAEQSRIEARDPADGKLRQVEVRAHGSTTAFADLAAGTCDVGLSSRRIKPEEAAELERKGMGDLQSPAGEHVLGLDGIAVIVHPNSTLHRIDLSNLRRAFTGQLSDFAGLGGSAGAIRLYARDDRSGTFDTFRHLVLGEHALASSATRYADSIELSSAVARDPAGMGFIGIPYVRSARALAVAEAGAKALYPSAFTVSTEGYALTRRLYLYVPVRGIKPLALDFVEFALSAEGQRVVKVSGFVDLTLHATDTGECERCPAKYAALSLAAKRVSLDFRFRSNSSNLDSRARRDLDRLVAYLRDHDQSRLTLVGFSDGRGATPKNLELSLERAKRVADELGARGVRAVELQAMGDALPVASNETENGRERNRRVEVWLR
jgi:phosphate transport system substrate-binding protein